MIPCQTAHVAPRPGGLAGMTGRSVVMRRLLIAVALVLLAAGCTSRQPSSPAGGAASTGQAAQGSAGGTQSTGQHSQGSAGSTATTSPRGVSLGATTIPTLRILWPQEGATFSLPAQIRYRVVGFDIEATGGAYIVVSAGNPTTGYRVDMPIKSLSGIAVLPDDKQLPGHRDLTFQLATAKHVLLTNPHAKATINDLLIAGRR
jgi:hypothetical protein